MGFIDQSSKFNTNTSKDGYVYLGFSSGLSCNKTVYIGTITSFQISYLHLPQVVWVVLKQLGKYNLVKYT